MTATNSAEGIILKPRNRHNHEPDRKRIYDCITIGTGVAGYASAMYAARLGMKVLIIGEVPGGTIALTGAVENYPGFISINGQMLAQLIENHAMDYDVDFLMEKATDIRYDKKKKEFSVFAGNKEYKSKTIILATGAKVRKLGIDGEKEFFGKGVGYCALCDATHMKNKTAAIAGGGDGAVKEAILLSEYAKKVYIINNEHDVHPEMANRKKLQALIKKGRIETVNNNEITEITGKEEVKSITLKKKHKGKKSMHVQGVFIYIGHDPESRLAKTVGARLNSKKEVVTNKRSETNIPGFFAAGDVTNSEWKQAITGVSQGVSAAYYAYQFCLKYWTG